VGSDVPWLRDRLLGDRHAGAPDPAGAAVHLPVHPRVNSLTVADVDGPTLTVRQVAAGGREVDRFVVTKGPGTDRGAAASP
jgi:hypothetical protein